MSTIRLLSAYDDD